MSQFFRTAGVLAAVCFLSALLLSVTAILTSEPIAKTAQKKKDAARRLVLAAAAYRSLPLPAESEISEYAGRYLKRTGTSFFRYRSAVQTNYSLALNDAGQTIGYIFDVRSPGGYGGRMDIIVGVRRSDTGSLSVSDYLVISSQETPGLGKAVEVSMHAVFTNPGSVKRFSTLNPGDRKTDCVSGATVTSVAIKDAAYAALCMAAVVSEREYVRLDVPEADLALVPYSQTYQPVRLPPHEAVRECLDVRWFGQTSGYVLKIVLRDAAARKNYLALAGFAAPEGRLHETRLLEIPLATNEAFMPVQGFRAGIFSQTEAASLLTNAALSKLEKELAVSIAAGRAMLTKAGRLP